VCRWPVCKPRPALSPPATAIQSRILGRCQTTRSSAVRCCTPLLHISVNPLNDLRGEARGDRLMDPVVVGLRIRSRCARTTSVLTYIGLKQLTGTLQLLGKSGVHNAMQEYLFRRDRRPDKVPRARFPTHDLRGNHGYGEPDTLDCILRYCPSGHVPGKSSACAW
jgi:hypothetical protein